MWKRGNVLIEEASGTLVLRNGDLPERLAETLAIDAGSPHRLVIDFLTVPRSDGELTAHFSNVDLYAVMWTLSAAGLVFRSEAAERAFVLRRVAGSLIAAAEDGAQDVLGYGRALFEGGRASLGERTFERLKEAERLLAAVRQDLSEARTAFAEGQLSQTESPPEAGDLRLNLGSGPARIPGWIGIDVQDSDLRWNLRWGLPFADGSASTIYSSHFLEHLTFAEAVDLLTEARRVLREGGVLRLVVPDIALLIEAYSRGDVAFFQARARLWPRESDGTPLLQILTYAGAGAEGRDLGRHRFGYDFATLSAALRAAGFSSITASTFNGSDKADLRIDHYSPAASISLDGTHFSLFVEAIR